MAENTTRIDDLPANISMKMSNDMGMPVKKNDFMANSTTYSPINIQPNPYGNSVQPTTNNRPIPEFTNQIQMPTNMMTGMIGSDKSFFSNETTELLQQMPSVRLPSRDIPMDKTYYQQDEEITPNYIPKPKLTGDYVREYEEASEKKLQKHEKNKKMTEKIDHTLTDIQTPLLITLLYFIFQLPILHTLMYKYLTILPIFHSDGNLNFYGILFKSILFGILFWGFQNIINFTMTF
jgi:hypothetical protein